MGPQSFLDVVARDPIAARAAGDEYGGAAGTYGRGLPTGAPGNFMFATGIECSYPKNPELPVHFAAYADAVAARYPWVRYYTPVNEIYVTAKMSAKDGAWNEQLTSDRGFVTAIKHATAASILATHRIAARRPDCVIVQSESAEYTHDVRAED